MKTVYSHAGVTLTLDDTRLILGVGDRNIELDHKAGLLLGAYLTRWAEAYGRLTPREKGTNPRAHGTNPRATMTNPRAIETFDLDP